MLSSPNLAILTKVVTEVHYRAVSQHHCSWSTTLGFISPPIPATSFTREQTGDVSWVLVLSWTGLPGWWKNDRISHQTGEIPTGGIKMSGLYHTVNVTRFCQLVPVCTVSSINTLF